MCVCVCRGVKGGGWGWWWGRGGGGGGMYLSPVELLLQLLLVCVQVPHRLLLQRRELRQGASSASAATSRVSSADSDTAAAGAALPRPLHGQFLPQVLHLLLQAHRVVGARAGHRLPPRVRRPALERRLLRRQARLHRLPALVVCGHCRGRRTDGGGRRRPATGGLP